MNHDAVLKELDKLREIGEVWMTDDKSGVMLVD
jgi:hypothetical protein